MQKVERFGPEDTARKWGLAMTMSLTENWLMTVACFVMPITIQEDVTSATIMAMGMAGLWPWTASET